MLSMREYRDDDGNLNKLELCGEAEPVERFSADLFESDTPHLRLVDGVIVLQDDGGRVVRYRVTGTELDGQVLLGELIEA